MKKIALITNYNIPEKLSAALLVADKISEYAEEIIIPLTFKDRILRNKSHRREFAYKDPTELYSSAELVIVLGGDGAMLDAARRVACHGTPIIGINMGRIGYMTELEMDELHMLSRVFEGRYRIDERAMLEAEVVSAKSVKKFMGTALNEATITNGQAARIVDLQLSDGEELVYTYRADGLIISTPTGSTAYSLSAGGPIVDPKLACFCVTPICPHTFSARPLVFPDSAELKVKNICVREKVLQLTLDGRVTYDLYHGDVVTVRRAATSVRLVRLKEQSFYSKIRMNKFV